MNKLMISIILLLVVMGACTPQDTQDTSGGDLGATDDGTGAGNELDTGVDTQEVDEITAKLDELDW